MENYTITLNGIIRMSDGAVIPTSEDNIDYQAFRAWCLAGNTPLTDLGQHEPDYRAKRKEAYLGNDPTFPGLGKDPGFFENQVGDVFDVVISELVARGSAVTPAFQTLIAQIAQIKATYPPD